MDSNPQNEQQSTGSVRKPVKKYIHTCYQCGRVWEDVIVRSTCPACRSNQVGITEAEEEKQN